MSVSIMVGDCLLRMREMADNSVDACVTDPPYHLVSIVKRFGSATAAPAQVGKTGAYARASKGFMGQTWDGGDVAFRVETWAEVLRVLKPGGHMLAFAATRGGHRMACAIEDAGFEIRDCLGWAFASGFPKSLNVSKALDRMAGAEREVVALNPNSRPAHKLGGAGFDAAVGGEALGPMVETAPATDEAREWEGWGTALKPAWEMIYLARKPLSEKSIAANVLKWGTGALNIDATRIPLDGIQEHWANYTPSGKIGFGGAEGEREGPAYNDKGRWPANLCHDGSEEVLAGFPEARSSQGGGVSQGGGIWGSCGPHDGSAEQYYDSGSAARFFYSAKVSAEERAGSNHPTMKPIALMQWLCRLVTPKGGTILDPFCGSGSTLIAADAEQFNAIGCELSPEYAAIAERRIKDAAGMFADVKVAA